MIRTIEKAYEELKARDPDTGLTKNFVRTIVTNGVVPSLMVGNKRLVDVDVLEDYVATYTGAKARETRLKAENA